MTLKAQRGQVLNRVVIVVPVYVMNLNVFPCPVMADTTDTVTVKKNLYVRFFDSLAHNYCVDLQTAVQPATALPTPP